MSNPDVTAAVHVADEAPVFVMVNATGVAGSPSQSVVRRAGLAVDPDGVERVIPFDVGTRPDGTGVEELFVFPLPKSPPLDPQQATPPSETTAHAKPPLAAIAMTPVRFDTGTGVNDVVVVPSPSWPSELSPQQATVWSERSAQAKSSPAEIAVTPVRFDTGTGIDESVVVPFPSSPDWLSPQQETVPLVTAHANSSPSEIAVTPVRFDTRTGTSEFVVVPSPSWPSSPSPQQVTVPSASEAHADSNPTAMAVAPVRFETGTGIDDPVVVPFPSSPDELSPQQETVPPESRAQALEICSHPLAIAVAPVRFDTGTGSEEFVVVPFPSWPLPL